MPPQSAGAGARPALSVVTSLYNSAGRLRAFYERVAAAADAVSADCEIIMVNDGSPDDALAVALDLRERDSRIQVIDLSRNFGHHKALMTGLGHARGDLVFLIDSDLEEDPAWLGQFHERLRSTGADVIYGVQGSRKGNWLERATGALFFHVFNHLLAHPIPANVVTARLMTRRYVQSLVQHRDREVCLAGLWMITGFEQLPLTVSKGSNDGSSYSVRRRISVFVNAITSFSNRPLMYIFQIGVLVMALSTAAGGILLYKSLRGEVGVPGWASIMVSIWFLGGVTIFCVGVLGIYLGKIFTEAKDRPYTVVRHVYGGQAEDQRER